MDFLKQHNCQIDVAANLLLIQGKKCKLTCSGSIGCYRVVVLNKVEIPAMSEMIIEGKVLDGGTAKNNLCIVEPKEGNFEGREMLVARSLVYGKDKTPVRIMNITNKTKTLYPETNIATLSHVSSVQTVNEVVIPENEKVPGHLKDLYERTITDMNFEQQVQVAKLLKKYSDVFSESDNDIGRTGIIKHRIPTGDAHPIKQRPRRVPVHMNEEIDKQLENMLKENVIQPSTSPWASSIVMVKKKDGSNRFCVDYRKLNDITIKDAYPLPRVDESLDQLTGSKWFSCLGLNSGYWQVETDPTDREKTAFTSRRGLFEFTVMPFGLCNAPATFERLMETILAGLHWEVCLIYLDDVIVTGKSFEDMVRNLGKVFERFQQAGLKLKPRKCKLFSKEVEFLGHIISESGIKTDPNKTKCVETWPTPKNVREVRAFVGLCSYYRRFIYKFSETAKPLHKLTEKNQPFVRTEECAKSFKELKTKLVEAPVLIYPDFTKSFILDVDASDLCIGAVLSQKTEEGERVVAYASKMLTKAERRYCVTRKELLALVHFVKYFRHYLYGKRFLVRTDHGSLRWLMNFKNPEGQVARWIELLSSFDMKIEHRPGKTHKNADGLSRIPCRQCGKVEEEGDSIAACSIRQSVNVAIDDTPIPDLKTAQSETRDISLVKGWVESCERPKWHSLSSESWFVKSLVNQWNRLAVHNDMLVRRWDVLGTNCIYWQAVAPLSHRKVALKYAHDIKASGHLGIKKTLSRLRQKYYWPGLQNDVKLYVGGCEKCFKLKGPNPTKKAPMQVVRSGFPMERLATDILGELPVTDNGNKYILVISDYFTKWTESFPMPNMESKTCAKLLVEEVVSRFGVPNVIHSDQGRQFESRLFKDMCELLQIEKTRTTPYHPQSDGMVERFNRTLCTMLSTFVEDNQRNWDTLLPYVMMAYRSTEHETTGMSPNMLMLGRETTIPLDIIYEMPPCLKPRERNEWVWELRENLESVHTFVRQNTGNAVSRQKRYHDQKTNYEQLEISDNVYVLFPVRKSGMSPKLTSFWKGPYKIMSKLSDVLYKVNCGRDGVPQIIHVDRIRKAVKQPPFTDESDASGMPFVQEEISLSPVEMPENTEEEIDDHEALTRSRFGRERRRPLWLDDYISSLFSTMPPLKTTPRKRHEKGCICPICKTAVGVYQNFQEHVLRCYEQRQKCTSCGATFKKAEYLKQHIKRKHAVNKSDEKCKLDNAECAVGNPTVNKEKSEESTSSSSSSSGSISDHDDAGNLSDWKEEPDIQIGEEEAADERKVNDVTSGRIYRKRTQPLPVPAPVKHQKVSATVTAADNGTADLVLDQKGQGFASAENEILPTRVANSDREINSKVPEIDTHQLEAQSNNTDSLEIEFSVKGDKDNKTTQQFDLIKGGETFISSTTINVGHISAGEMRFSLEDYFGPGDIEAKNISVQVEKEKLKLKFLR